MWGLIFVAVLALLTLAACDDSADFNYANDANTIDLNQPDVADSCPDGTLPDAETNSCLPLQ